MEYFILIEKNINLIDLKETISKEYYSLIEICIYHKLNFTFETGYILLTTGQLLVLPLKILNTYYFCVFNSNSNMMKKVKQFIKDDFRDKSYIIISKKIMILLYNVLIILQNIMNYLLRKNMIKINNIIVSIAVN